MILQVMPYTKKNNAKKLNRKTRSLKKNKVKTIIVDPKYSDEYMKSKEGEYFEEKDYDTIVKSDCDVYRKTPEGELILLLKYRKNVLSKNLTEKGMANLKKAAMKTHDNRGASAGVIDLSKLPKYANEMKQFDDKKVSKFRIQGYRSKTNGEFINNSFGNISHSNIIGFFDKRDRNLGSTAPPCRTTAFTSQQVEKWDNVVPLIQKIDKQFKRLTPRNYNSQYKRAHETKFVIPETSFSTVTINYNWQTALHKDAGDYKDGFGNLVVIEDPNGKYDGGYTGFPQYGVAVDVRNGDFLAMDVHEWHANTKQIPKTKDYTRLSLVCYLRENMLRCKNM
jgi:hypothetical protein